MFSNRNPARAAVISAALSALSLTPRAHAFVEARCPAGMQTRIASVPPGGPRVVVACAQPNAELAAFEVPDAIAPAQESGIGQQLLAGLRAAPPGAITFTPEDVAGHPARVAAFRAQQQLPGGARSISVLFANVAVGTGSLFVQITSPNAAQNLKPALRALLEGALGLDGAEPAWRVQVQCPPPYRNARVESPDPGGMYRAAACALPQAQRQIEVFESRLPVRNAQDARLEAELRANLIRDELEQQGGAVALEATQPHTFGTHPGFVTMVHARVPVQQAGMVRVEIVVGSFGIAGGGHVQLHAVSSNVPPAQVLADLDALAASGIRDDAPPPQAPSATGANPGTAQPGAAPGAPAAAPRARRREIDPSVPLWQPPAERRPADAGPEAGTEPPSRFGCTAAPARAGSGWAASFALLALAATATRRRRTAR